MLFDVKCEELMTQSLISQKERNLAPANYEKKIKVPRKDAEGKVMKDENGKTLYDVEVKVVINEDYDNPRYLFQRIAKYINYFSSIGEFQDRALDVDLAKIPIPAELAPFIMDRTYRIEPGNYLSKDQKKDSLFKDVSEDGLSITEWIKICYSLRSMKKVTTLKNMVTLDTLKKNVAFADVQSRCISKSKVHFEDVVFIPIELDDSILKSSFESNYFTHKSEDVLARYIAELKWTSNRD